VDGVQVRNHAVRVRAIKVCGDGVKRAAGASSHKPLHPLQAFGRIGASRGNKEITVLLERLNVLLPELCRVTGIQVRLTVLVRLIEAHDAVGISRLHQLLELPKLLGTPKHAAEFEAEFIDDGGFVRVPGVDR